MLVSITRKASRLSEILVSRKQVLACLLLFLLGTFAVCTVTLFARDDLVATGPVVRSEDVKTAHSSGGRRARRRQTSSGGSASSRSGRKGRGGSRSSSRGKSTGGQIGSVAKGLRARKVNPARVKQTDVQPDYPIEAPLSPALVDETGAYIWIDTGLESAHSPNSSSIPIAISGNDLDTLIEDPVAEYVDIKADSDSHEYDDEEEVKEENLGTVDGGGSDGGETAPMASTVEMEGREEVSREEASSVAGGVAKGAGDLEDDADEIDEEDDNGDEFADDSDREEGASDGEKETAPQAHDLLRENIDQVFDIKS